MRHAPRPTIQMTLPGCALYTRPSDNLSEIAGIRNDTRAHWCSLLFVFMFFYSDVFVIVIIGKHTHDIMMYIYDAFSPVCMCI